MASPTSLSTGCLNDDSFGPTVQGCRDDFDFTQKFERMLFSVVPASVFIVLAIARVVQLANKPRLIVATPFQLVKVLAIAVYVATQLSLLVLASSLDAAAVRGLSVAGAGLAFAAGLLMIVVSFLEHARARRTSALLNLYLLFTLLFDVVQARTLWLSINNTHQAVYTRLFTSAACVKLVILFFEAQGKARWINWSGKEHSPEQESGVFNLSVYYWLKQLFQLGYRGVLRFDDLYELDSAMTAEVAASKLMGVLEGGKDGKRPSLLKALLKAFTWEFLLPVCPQLALIAFKYSQSFFLQALIHFLDKGAHSSPNLGYGLIAASALIYIGMATSSSYKTYYNERAVSMTRACLCAVIYKKTTEITTTTAAEGASITLMSSDVQNVEFGVQLVHTMWSSLLQVGIGCWLLYTKLGIAFVTPIVIITVCSILLFGVMSFVQARQTRWMQKIETRVGLTANAVSNMKYFKMLGISEHVADRIQNLRLDEINAGTKFRVILLAAFVLSCIPMTASPPITFALTFRDMDAATLFVSLSFITLLTSPLSYVFQGLPDCLAALTSLGRIEAYLTQDPRQDFRLQRESQHSQIQQATQSKSKSSSETTAETDDTLSSVSTVPAFVISNGSFGWEADKMVLNDISISIPRNKISMVVGPIASGKSTLCKVLLGEIPFTSGSTEIRVPTKSIGYCAQNAFLSDATLMENIIGFSRFDQRKYDDVIHATMLDIDVEQLPLGHDTKIGSNGIVLSGGQKQRVSLARALYSESDIMIFDDILSGLDATTESKLFSRVFGQGGVIRKRGATALICTHSVRHLPGADHIVVLGASGVVVEQGTFNVLVNNGKYISNLGILASGSDVEEETAPIAVSEVSKSFEPSLQNEAVDAGNRQTGDWSVYMHYFGSINTVSLVTFAVLCVVVGATENFSTIWISYWAQDHFHSSRGFYIGIYGLISAANTLALAFGGGIGLTDLVSSAGLNLHRHAIETVVRAPLSLFTNTDTGTVTNLFSQDMTLIDGQLPLALINTSVNLATLIGSFFVVAVASPYLAISYPFLLAILYGIQMFYLRTSRQLRLLDLEAKSPLYNHYIDTTGGLATIRAFGWVDDEIERNRKLLNASQRPKYLLAMIQGWLQTNLLLLVGVISVCLTSLATQLKTSSGFTGASLLTLMNLTSSMTSLMQNYTELETSIGAVNRLRSFSERVKPENGVDEDGPVPEEWPSKGVVSLSSVSASYSTNASHDEEKSDEQNISSLAIDNLSLAVKSGERVAVCGRTGSGKSSLMLLLLRLLNPLPLCQHIQVDGIPLHRVNRSTLRQRFITIPQDSVFLPGSSSIKVNLDPLETATDEECLAVLNRVGLSDFVKDSGGLHASMNADSLSAGQQQLFGLGRAVLRRRLKVKAHGLTGGILLLDEMNSKLDNETDRICQEVLQDEFVGYTIIMVVHRLGMVMKMCDRVFVLEKGKLIEQGHPKILAETEGSRFGELWKETS